MYVVAFVLSWIFRFLEYLSQEGVVVYSDQGLKWLHTLRALLQPLQGFFNLMIFLYHKVYVLRTSCDEDVSLAKAIGIIVLRPEDMAEAMPISNLNAGIDEYFHTAPINPTGAMSLLGSRHHGDEVSGDLLYDEIEDPPSVRHEDIIARTHVSGHDDLSCGLSVKKNEAQRIYYKNSIAGGLDGGSSFFQRSPDTSFRSSGPAIKTPRSLRRSSRIRQSTVEGDPVTHRFEDDGDISMSSGESSLSQLTSWNNAFSCFSSGKSEGVNASASLGGLSNL